MSTTEVTQAPLDASEKDLAYIRNFRLLDDDFMAKFFEENIECTELILRIILDNPSLHVQHVHTQHEIRNLQGHSVSLDIYATDDEQKKYNIEVQRASKGAGAKRARYNSSVIDVNILPRGEDYDLLAETYVIFITEKDEIGANLPIYHIERTVRETGGLFGDDSHIIYVNSEFKDNTPLGDLMHDFACSNPSDMKYKVLAERARYLKESKEGIQVMCEAMEQMRNETALAERKKTACRLLKTGKFSIEEVVEYSDCTIEEVKELADEIAGFVTA